VKMYVENQSKLTEKDMLDEAWKIVDATGNHITVCYTGICFHCESHGCVIVDKNGYNNWVNGKLVHEAFPEMPIERREQLMNGIHPECWNELFGGYDCEYD